ncbi:MAG: transcription termination factor Rho [Syntrophales bacterium]|nr:transcription termination factor Rho [Syntrophales bacterium]
MSEEKPLDKLTVKELKEIALGIEGLHGVTAMKKDELLRVIKESRGIPIKKVMEKAVETIAGVKGQIVLLKEKREEMRAQSDRAGLKRLRRKISRLKKRTRKLVTPGA